MEDQDQGFTQPTELELLKERADVLGIKYSPNIGLDTLRERVNAKIKGEPSEELLRQEQATIRQGGEYGELSNPRFTPTPEQLAAIQRKAAMKLVRIRLVNMNPINNNVPAYIASVGNAQIGFIKKAIPFNVPWHIPQILLNFLKTKKYLAHYEVPDPRKPGKKIKRTREVPEFSVEILPNLTDQELMQLKQRQLIQQGATQEQ